MYHPLFMAACLVLISCKKNNGSEPIDMNPVKIKIKAGIVDEASGIADSKLNAGHLWVQEDSDSPSEITLLTHKGVLVKKIPIRGIINRDWEDMAVAKGPNPGVDYVYIAEIGDNNAVHPQCYFYRFPEPSVSATEVASVETISFRYPDGARDAEAFIVDPEKGDIYILTKRETQSRVYKLTAPYSTSSLNTLTFMGTLPYTGVVSAAITPDGNGVAVKTYQQIYYYTRTTGETLDVTLKKTATNLKYEVETQGEAITFTNDNIGYFTLGERVITDVTLNYYKR
jgi:hypothetical protein